MTKKKAKNHVLTDYLTQASLFVKKDLMKRILRKPLLTFQSEFYSLYYIVKIFLVKYSMLGYLSPITNCTEFLDRPIFINLYTKLVFCSNNPFFFYCNPPNNISDKFTLLESFEGFYNQVWSQWLIKRN